MACATVTCSRSVNDTPAPDGLDEIRDLIRIRVAAGYSDRDSILDSALADALDDPPEGMDESAVEALVEAEVGRAFEEHARRQADFPEVTDYDRLHAAFTELERDGIVAREDFTCCGTCGAAEIGDEMLRHGAARGYTFFHEQGTEAAVENGGLYLSYGASVAGEENGVAVGREVEATLRRHGLTTRWSGRLAQRIAVDMTWQRRRP
jgi:hypothetical protein